MPLLVRSIVLGVTLGVTLFELYKLLASATQPQRAKVKCLNDDDDDDDNILPTQNDEDTTESRNDSLEMEIECTPNGENVRFTLIANNSDDDTPNSNSTTTRIPLEIQLDEAEQEDHKDVLQRIASDMNKLRNFQQQQQQQAGSSTSTEDQSIVKIQLDVDDVNNQEFFQILHEYVMVQQQEILDEAASARSMSESTITTRTRSIEY